MRLATSPEQDGCVTAHAAFAIPFLEDSAFVAWKRRSKIKVMLQVTAGSQAEDRKWKYNTEAGREGGGNLCEGNEMMKGNKYLQW
jgi:hypothetical protein